MEENKIKAYFVLICIGDPVLEWLPLGPIGKVWVINMVYTWSYFIVLFVFSLKIKWTSTSKHMSSFGRIRFKFLQNVSFMYPIFSNIQYIRVITI